MNVFTYWEGVKPELIHVLHKLMQLHSKCPQSHQSYYTFKCITKEEFLTGKSEAYRNYFSGLVPRFQADIVRVDLIYQDGGIWLDSDTLVMSNLQTLQKILQAKDGFLIAEQGKKGAKLCNGVFGSQAGTPLMTEWKKMIDDHISRQEQPRHGDLGFRCLSQLLYSKEQLFSNYTIFNGQQTMYPVAWFESKDIFLSRTPTQTSTIARDFQPLIILLGNVYRNYKGIYTQNGEECALDIFIQKSLKNLITDFSANTDIGVENLKKFEYNSSNLISTARLFIKQGGVLAISEKMREQNQAPVDGCDDNSAALRRITRQLRHIDSLQGCRESAEQLLLLNKNSKDALASLIFCAVTSQKIEAIQISLKRTQQATQAGEAAFAKIIKKARKNLTPSHRILLKQQLNIHRKGDETSQLYQQIESAYKSYPDDPKPLRKLTRKLRHYNTTKACRRSARLLLERERNSAEAIASLLFCKCRGITASPELWNIFDLAHRNAEKKPDRTERIFNKVRASLSDVERTRFEQHLLNYRNTTS